MVYKKYVKKEGKIFGPYYCESYRDKDGKVKTRFLSGPEGAEIYEKPSGFKFRFKINRKKNFFDLFSWNRKLNYSNFAKDFRIEKPLWMSSETLKKSLSLFFIGVLLIAGLGFVIMNSNLNLNGKFTGFAIWQNTSEGQMENMETVVENFDSSSVDLSVREPVSFGLFGEAITKNKNKRMEFDLNGKNLRLYFDLLNYSEFVEGVAETNIGNVMQDKEEGTSERENATEVITNESESIVNVSEQVNNETNAAINETENASNIVNVTQDKEGEQGSLMNETDQQSVGITGYFTRFFGLIGRVIAGEENSTLNETLINVTEINQSTEQQLPQTSSDNNIVTFDNNDAKQTAENLSRSEVETIADNSVVKAENFDIKVNSSKINNEKPEYKWGYRVKLNDLEFMAKIDITSDEAISIYNDNTLKIGRNLLSFDDLAKAGYKVRIESPSLEIPVNVSVNLTEVKERKFTIINKTGEIENVTEVNITEVNVTEINKTEVNKTETNVTLQNETIINETIIVNETEINITSGNEKQNIVNETNEENVINNSIEGGGSESGQGEVGKQEEKKAEQKETGNEKKTNSETQIPATDEKKASSVPDGTEEKAEQQANDKESKGQTKENKKEKKQEGKTETSTPSEPSAETRTPAPAPTETVVETPIEIITGGVIKFFKFTGNMIASSVTDVTEGIVGTGKVVFGTGKAVAGFVGRVIGIEENATEVLDVKYANTITIYIERDFTNTNYSVGDIIELDPTLIIIPITNAEELDSNRSYIRNIYNETSAKDENYVLINNSHFVRATFKQALGKNNDITVFARVFGYFCNETIIENCENRINETTNETQEVCNNVTIENCPEISESEKGKIEVYKENGNDAIAKIENITKADYYKTYLDGLHGGVGLGENESYDVFDLRIMSLGNVLINNFVNINGQEVSYDAYQKKKRIDEIKKILFQNFLSVQFLILFAFLPKLNIRRLLSQG